MSFSRIGIFALITSVVAACAPDSRTVPTDPDPAVRAVVAASSTCSNQLGNQIAAEQRALFSGATLKTAQSLWQPVTRGCKNAIDQAREDMLAYVRFTITSARGGNVLGATPAQSVVQHWNLVYQYVGYAEPGLPAMVLSDSGSARVILKSEAVASGTEFGIQGRAAMTFYAQAATADQRGHLFTIRPAIAGCLSTNLVEAGPCYEIAASPALSAAMNPVAKVGVCQLHNLSYGNSPALGHQESSAVPATVLAGPTVYPSAAFCDSPAELTPPQFGFSGLLRRFVSATAQIFVVQPAYAAHGGLGGVTEGLSPFGAVDLRVFEARFADVAIGTSPQEGLIPSPDIGSWTKVEVASPGSILVQQSLGNLTTKPVVLSQGGGNCGPACGGLDLWGTINSSASGVEATTGRYEVTWRSLQNGPTLKSAPFVLRDNAGREIARLVYVQKSSKNLLIFNGDTLQTTDGGGSPVQLGWVRNVAQTFTITVDLDTQKTWLKVDNTSFTATEGKPFVDIAAANLSSIRAEFVGIDSGIMGWDDIRVVRLANGN